MAGMASRGALRDPGLWSGTALRFAPLTRTSSRGAPNLIAALAARDAGQGSGPDDLRRRLAMCPLTPRPLAVCQLTPRPLAVRQLAMRQRATCRRLATRRRAADASQRVATGKQTGTRDRFVFQGFCVETTVSYNAD